jgi:hypothetical protein
MTSSLIEKSLAELEPNPGQQHAPVFVVGAPRSGTSMLAWALAEHSQFATSFETDIIIELMGGNRLPRAYRKARARPDGWLGKHQMPMAEFCAHLGTGLDHLYRSRLTAHRWIDATPRHVLMGQQLALLFPQSRFLHIVRDGRQAVESMIHSGFRAWSARSFLLSCVTWVRYVRTGRKLARIIPRRVLEIRYEELVQDERSWEDILGFLAVESHPGCAEFVCNNRINSSFGHSNDASGQWLDKPARGKSWSKLQNMIFNRVAGPLMKELGYHGKPPDMGITPGS